MEQAQVPNSHALPVTKFQEIADRIQLVMCKINECWGNDLQEVTRSLEHNIWYANEMLRRHHEVEAASDTMKRIALLEMQIDAEVEELVEKEKTAIEASLHKSVKEAEKALEAAVEEARGKMEKTFVEAVAEEVPDPEIQKIAKEFKDKLLDATRAHEDKRRRILMEMDEKFQLEMEPVLAEITQKEGIKYKEVIKDLQMKLATINMSMLKGQHSKLKAQAERLQLEMKSVLEERQRGRGKDATKMYLESLAGVVQETVGPAQEVWREQREARAAAEAERARRKAEEKARIENEEKARQIAEEMDKLEAETAQQEAEKLARMGAERAQQETAAMAAVPEAARRSSSRRASLSAQAPGSDASSLGVLYDANFDLSALQGMSGGEDEISLLSLGQPSPLAAPATIQRPVPMPRKSQQIPKRDDDDSSLGLLPGVLSGQDESMLGGIERRASEAGPGPQERRRSSQARKSADESSSLGILSFAHESRAGSMTFPGDDSLLDDLNTGRLDINRTERLPSRGQEQQAGESDESSLGLLPGVENESIGLKGEGFEDDDLLLD